MRTISHGCANGRFHRALAIGCVMVLGITSVGCSTGNVSGQRTQMTSEPTAPFAAPKELKYFRQAAERYALQAQGYRYARTRIDAQRPSTGRWAIVLDADETILDNTGYQERVAKGTYKEWTQGTWDGWVKEKTSPPFPAAKQFLQDLRRTYPDALIAIVTNRSQDTCEATAEVLNKHEVPFDALLCAQPVSKDKLDTNKEPRFAQVASGAAFKLAQPVKVIMFVGDNIKDCPGQSQQSYDVSRYGDTCIILPNPMYGDWERAPYVPVEP